MLERRKFPNLSHLGTQNYMMRTPFLFVPTSVARFVIGRLSQLPLLGYAPALRLALCLALMPCPDLGSSRRCQAPHIAEKLSQSSVHPHSTQCCLSHSKHAFG